MFALSAGCTMRVGTAQLLHAWQQPVAPVPEAPGRANVEVAAPGATLRGWLLHAPGNEFAAVYFYGNGESVLDAQQHISWLSSALRADVLALDYRGYGFSDGETSFPALAEDALRVYERAAELGKPLLVVGRSLGTAFAVRVAARRPVAAVLLFAPPTSVEEVVEAIQAQLPFLSRLFVRLRPDEALRALGPQPVEEIARITAPLLVVLGTEDNLVVPEAARRMHRAAGSTEKSLCEIRASHNRTSPDHPDARRCVLAFVEERRGRLTRR